MTNTNSKKNKSVEVLIGQHMSINHHVLKSMNINQENINAYLESLVIPLMKQDELTDKQHIYLSTLGKFLGYKDLASRIEQAITSKISPPTDNAFHLLDDNKALQAAWIVDATFLSINEGAMTEFAKTIIKTMTEIFQLKESTAKTLIRHAKALATSEDAERLIDAIAHLNRRYQCSAWQTILDYRRVSVADAINALNTRLVINSGARELLSEINKVRMGGLLNCMDFGETNILMRGALKIQKRFTLSDFNNILKKAEIFGESQEALVSEANDVLAAFGYEGEYNPYSPLIVFTDTDTSASNTEWQDNMEKAFDDIEQYLNGWQNTCYAISSKLDKIAEEKWADLLNEAQLV